MTEPIAPTLVAPGPNDPASALVPALTPLGDSARDQAVLAAAARGAFPRFLRTLVPLHLESDGHTATAWVMPDVFALGTDADFVRMPLCPEAADALLGSLGMLLPTRRLVDAMFRQAAVRVSPHPFSPAPHETRSAMRLVLASQAAIERERAGRPGLLTGAKKHVVLAAHTGRDGFLDRLWIYGWWFPTLAAALAAGYTDGKQYVQSLTTAHDHHYEDYSHGIQGVWHTLWVDGAPREYADVLADPVLCKLVSDEGPVLHAHYPGFVGPVAG